MGVSVVATGMGMAMMDFVVRECRAVVDGQMAICRLGGGWCKLEPRSTRCLNGVWSQIVSKG